LNPLRDRRLYEVRRRLHTVNLDIGAGSFPITEESVTFDIQPQKHPDKVGNVLDGLPFPDKAFDSVTALEILEHFKTLDQLKILSEINRVLCPGGQLIVTVPYSNGIMKPLQNLAWEVRSHTSQREYHENSLCAGHIGLVSSGELLSMMRFSGFDVLESKRIMLYDFLARAVKV
jgi:SAM-dependent methyltransferase